MPHPSQTQAGCRKLASYSEPTKTKKKISSKFFDGTPGSILAILTKYQKFTPRFGQIP